MKSIYHSPQYRAQSRTHAPRMRRTLAPAPSTCALACLQVCGATDTRLPHFCAAAARACWRQSTASSPTATQLYVFEVYKCIVSYMVVVCGEASECATRTSTCPAWWRRRRLLGVGACLLWRARAHSRRVILSHVNVCACVFVLSVSVCATRTALTSVHTVHTPHLLRVAGAYARSLMLLLHAAAHI